MGQGTWGEETEYTEAMSEQLPSLSEKHLLANCNHVFYRPGNCSVLSDLRNVCIDFLIAGITKAKIDVIIIF